MISCYLAFSWGKCLLVYVRMLLVKVIIFFTECMLRMFTEPFLINFLVDYKTTNLDIKLVLDVDILYP